MGDRVKKVSELKAQVPRELAIERLDTEISAIEPGSSAIVVEASRGPAALNPLSTFRRDRSALNLLPGSDGEWIMWMPESFYDTSIAGDRRLLGWHLNGSYRERKNSKCSLRILSHVTL